MIKSEILEEGLSLKVFQKEVLESYTQTLDAFTVALQKIRISRAHPSLLEHIKVMAYGSPTNLKDIAIIAASDTLTLTVEPFDKGLLSSIEATLSQAEHALNPKNNKNKLIINLPPMSQERRRELTKETKKKRTNL
jgi:ribosome recycling factor